MTGETFHQQHIGAKSQGFGVGLKEATAGSNILLLYAVLIGYDLVGGWATPLKNMKVSWDDYSQYMGK